MRYLVALAQLSLLSVTAFASLKGTELLRGPDPSPAGAVIFIVAILSFGALIFWAERTSTAGGLGLGAVLIDIWRYSPRTVLSVVLLTASLCFTALCVALAREDALQPWRILAIWGTGCSLTMIGAYLSERPKPAEPRAPAWSSWEIPIVTGLALLAFLVRAMGNGQFPQTIHGDEGEMGLVAREVLSGALRDPFTTAWLSHPSLWFFLQAGALRLLSNDISGLRTLSALIGTAAIPALYWFARPLYGRTISLASAILLTALPLHLHFSRIALNNIVDPTIALLAFGALFHAWRTGSRTAFAGAGLLIGLGQYFYFGARVVPVIMLTLLVHQLIFDRRRVLSNWRGLLLLIAGALASSGPLLRHFADEPGTLTARIDELGLFQSGRVTELLRNGDSLVNILASQFWLSFSAYTSISDRSLFYAGESPILTPLESVLFLCGLGVAIWRWRHPEQYLLALWVVYTAFFGGALIVDPPQIPRYVIATPAIVLLVAQGAAQFARLASQACGITFPRVIPATTALVSLALMAQGISYYKTDYLPKEYYGGVRDLTAIARYLETRDTPTYTFFLGAPYAYIGHGTIRFVAHEAPGADVLEPITSPTQVPDPPAGVRALYIALPARAEELRFVAERYPSGRMWAIPDRLFEGQPLYVIYEAP